MRRFLSFVRQILKLLGTVNTCISVQFYNHTCISNNYIESESVHEMQNSTELAVELDEKYTRASQMVCVSYNCYSTLFGGQQRNEDLVGNNTYTRSYCRSKIASSIGTC